MKATIRFWKNFDCTFGACITLTLVPDSQHEFPTACIFDQFGNIASAAEKESSDTLNFAHKDFESLYVIHSWVDETIKSLQQLVLNYFTTKTPDTYEILL